jgi:hypothetical protein
MAKPKKTKKPTVVIVHLALDNYHGPDGTLTSQVEKWNETEGYEWKKANAAQITEFFQGALHLHIEDAP